MTGEQLESGLLDYMIHVDLTREHQKIDEPTCACLRRRERKHVRGRMLPSPKQAVKYLIFNMYITIFIQQQSMAKLKIHNYFKELTDWSTMGICDYNTFAILNLVFCYKYS